MPGYDTGVQGHLDTIEHPSGVLKLNYSSVEKLNEGLLTLEASVALALRVVALAPRHGEAATVSGVRSVMEAAACILHG